MATFRTSQCQDGDENFRALKDALENLNTRAQIRVHQQGFWREFCQKSLFLVPWVHGSFISLGYPQNSWGVEVNPSPKIRCFTLMPTPLVAILYFPLTSLVFFGFPIQRTAIPTTRLRPSEKRELFRKLFLNNFCKHVLELIVPHYLTRRNLSLVLFPLKVFHPRWLTSRTGPLLPHFSIDRSHCQRNIFLKFINQRTVIYIWSPVRHSVLPLLPSVCVLLFCKV